MKYQGVKASGGIALGRAFVKQEPKLDIDYEQIEQSQVDSEQKRFHSSLEKSKEQLEIIKKRTEERLGQQKAEIFQAHKMLLEDPELISSVEQKITQEKYQAEAAVDKVIQQFAEMFANMEDEYMRERGADLQDVGRRILKNLLGYQDEAMEFQDETVVIAEDLAPSDTARLDTDKVVAFVTKEGSKTSHTAIMARSLGIPAVVGLGYDQLLDETEQGEQIIVDGENGDVIVAPDENTVSTYQDKLANYREKMKIINEFKDKAAETRDGKTVEVAGNIGNPNDVAPVLENGGEGIGLFRTEFLYMDREELPSEDEQYEAYKKVLQQMGDKPVVIRTLDIGGDKDLPYLDLGEEENPFLGYRAIRISLNRSDIFKPQLKAILRAGVYGNPKIMFPMIASLEEVKTAKQLLEEAKNELEKEGVQYLQDVEVGIMIEIPSTVMIADELAEQVDFFSIGTNDLIQYTIAVDRGNERISNLYTPYHPSVLRLIDKTIRAGHNQDIWVGMCGEAAGDELLAPFLLGAGLDEFSMSAGSIPAVKRVINAWTVSEAEQLLQRILGISTSSEIERELYNAYKDKGLIIDK